MIRFVIVAFVSYVAAAPLTQHISMDLSQTHWDSLWTYFFWLFSLAIWGLLLFVVLPLLAAVVVAVLDR